MFNIYKRHSERWFPWVKEDNHWKLVTSKQTLDEAKHYIEVYCKPVYEYKIEKIDE